MKQAALAETQSQEKVVLGKRTKDDLRFKPNLEMLGDQESDEEQGIENEQSGESGSEDFEYGDEDESEISEDKPKKSKKAPIKNKKGEQVSKDKTEKDVYKPAKLNPIMYQDQIEKRSKKIQREESHAKDKLSKHNYIQMLKEEMDDRPEEVMGAFGQGKKTQYMKDMETLEKVELQNFSRMQMTKAQKKFHRQQMLAQNVDKLDQIDEYTVANLRLRYEINEDLRLFATVQNLFNQEFETFGLLGEEPNELEVPIIENLEKPIFLGAASPRAGYIGLSYSF